MHGAARERPLFCQRAFGVDDGQSCHQQTTGDSVATTRAAAAAEGQNKASNGISKVTYYEFITGHVMLSFMMATIKAA